MICLFPCGRHYVFKYIFLLLYTTHSNELVSISLQTSLSVSVRLKPRSRLDKLKHVRHFNLDPYHETAL